MKTRAHAIARELCCTTLHLYNIILHVRRSQVAVKSQVSRKKLQVASKKRGKICPFETMYKCAVHKSVVLPKISKTANLLCLCERVYVTSVRCLQLGGHSMQLQNMISQGCVVTTKINLNGKRWQENLHLVEARLLFPSLQNRQSLFVIFFLGFALMNCALCTLQKITKRNCSAAYHFQIFSLSILHI